MKKAKWLGPASLLVCALALVGVLHAGEKEAQPFTSKEGKFSIKMPGKPANKQQEVDSAQGKLIINMFFVSPTQSSVYLVSYNDYTEVGDPQQMLDGVRDGNNKNLKGEITMDRKITITLGGKEYPGRDIMIEKTAVKMPYRARIYLVGNRLYQVVVHGPEEFVLGKEAVNYFKSFELLDNKDKE